MINDSIIKLNYQFYFPIKNYKCIIMVDQENIKMSLPFDRIERFIFIRVGVIDRKLNKFQAKK
jgi:hypothetical protein